MPKSLTIKIKSQLTHGHEALIYTNYSLNERSLLYVVTLLLRSSNKCEFFA